MNPSENNNSMSGDGISGVSTQPQQPSSVTEANPPATMSGAPAPYMSSSASSSTIQQNQTYQPQFQQQQQPPQQQQQLQQQSQTQVYSPQQSSPPQFMPGSQPSQPPQQYLQSNQNQGSPPQLVQHMYAQQQQQQQHLPPLPAQQLLQKPLVQDDDDEDEDHKVVETDPTGRFERYVVSLGKGAYKNVFKAFDTEEGVEVAWNQLRLDHLNKRDASRILSEIRILESLRNEHIINLFYSWNAKGRDGKDRVFFITELMTSGTLKSYIRKTKGPVKPKVLRNWCRQILSGLHYLHTRDPPIIHRDLKCENIFINGNNGQAKIGDLGLATIKNRDHVSSVLGTPEFMAPELYDERYDEKVDIYAFGMVVLEIVTKEYPYSECTNQAQIYKKVTTGIKPLALSKVTDEETKKFIECCIAYDPKARPAAEDLLRHPFLDMQGASMGAGSQNMVWQQQGSQDNLGSSGFSSGAWTTMSQSTTAGFSYTSSSAGRLSSSNVDVFDSSGGAEALQSQRTSMHSQQQQQSMQGMNARPSPALNAGSPASDPLSSSMNGRVGGAASGGWSSQAGNIGAVADGGQMHQQMYVHQQQGSQGQARRIMSPILPLQHPGQALIRPPSHAHPQQMFPPNVHPQQPPALQMSYQQQQQQMQTQMHPQQMQQQQMHPAGMGGGMGTRGTSTTSTTSHSQPTSPTLSQPTMAQQLQQQQQIQQHHQQLQMQLQMRLSSTASSNQSTSSISSSSASSSSATSSPPSMVSLQPQPQVQQPQSQAAQLQSVQQKPPVAAAVQRPTVGPDGSNISVSDVSENVNPSPSTSTSGGSGDVVAVGDDDIINDHEQVAKMGGTASGSTSRSASHPGTPPAAAFTDVLSQGGSVQDQVESNTESSDTARDKEGTGMKKDRRSIPPAVSTVIKIETQDHTFQVRTPVPDPVALVYHHGAPLPGSNLNNANPLRASGSETTPTAVALSNPSVAPHPLASSTGVAAAPAGVPAVAGASPATAAQVVQTSQIVVEVVENAAGIGEDEILLKMVYVVPGKPNQEIKFPFNLGEDTATDVVSEMVKENLIEAEDETMARRRLEEAIRNAFKKNKQQQGGAPGTRLSQVGPPQALQQQQQQGSLAPGQQRQSLSTSSASSSSSQVYRSGSQSSVMGFGEPDMGSQQQQRLERRPSQHGMSGSASSVGAMMPHAMDPNEMMMMGDGDVAPVGAMGMGMNMDSHGLIPSEAQALVAGRRYSEEAMMQEYIEGLPYAPPPTMYENVPYMAGPGVPPYMDPSGYQTGPYPHQPQQTVPIQIPRQGAMMGYSGTGSVGDYADDAYMEYGASGHEHAIGGAPDLSPPDNTAIYQQTGVSPQHQSQPGYQVPSSPPLAQTQLHQQPHPQENPKPIVSAATFPRSLSNSSNSSGGGAGAASAVAAGAPGMGPMKAVTLPRAASSASLASSQQDGLRRTLTAYSATGRAGAGEGSTLGRTSRSPSAPASPILPRSASVVSRKSDAGSDSGDTSGSKLANPNEHGVPPRRPSSASSSSSTKTPSRPGTPSGEYPSGALNQQSQQHHMQWYAQQQQQGAHPQQPFRGIQQAYPPYPQQHPAPHPQPQTLPIQLSPRMKAAGLPIQGGAGGVSGYRSGVSTSSNGSEASNGGGGASMELPSPQMLPGSMVQQQHPYQSYPQGQMHKQQYMRYGGGNMMMGGYPSQHPHPQQGPVMTNNNGGVPAEAKFVEGPPPLDLPPAVVGVSKDASSVGGDDSLSSSVLSSISSSGPDDVALSPRSLAMEQQQFAGRPVQQHPLQQQQKSLQPPQGVMPPTKSPRMVNRELPGEMVQGVAGMNIVGGGGDQRQQLAHHHMQYHQTGAPHALSQAGAAIMQRQKSMPGAVGAQQGYGAYGSPPQHQQGMVYEGAQGYAGYMQGQGQYFTTPQHQGWPAQGGYGMMGQRGPGGQPMGQMVHPGGPSNAGGNIGGHGYGYVPQNSYPVQQNAGQFVQQHPPPTRQMPGPPAGMVGANQNVAPMTTAGRQPQRYANAVATPSGGGYAAQHSAHHQEKQLPQQHHPQQQHFVGQQAPVGGEPAAPGEADGVVVVAGYQQQQAPPQLQQAPPAGVSVARSRSATSETQPSSGSGGSVELNPEVSKNLDQ
ncbi:Serine/threonine-protein kinase wnk3 [Quaeritorhiza haematococci]|nr:Serine/threonine-protein kinase wnk3 [Quaeritorhiza haematococci]